ncbi:hypothetical protein A2U01_0098893, partial [Trifolium medium]|nr:hypothetical protein [Trifolium medium]
TFNKDSAADSVSAIDEDEDIFHDVDMEVSAEVQSSTLYNHICFGSFGHSDLSTVHLL